MKIIITEDAKGVISRSICKFILHRFDHVTKIFPLSTESFLRERKLSPKVTSTVLRLCIAYTLELKTSCVTVAVYVVRSTICLLVGTRESISSSAR